MWNDISEARMIVEYSMPGFQIEPSQGTHFFQNITSLGVGYLAIDSLSGHGSIDFQAIGSMEQVSSMKYATVLRAPEEIVAYIDRNTNRAVAGITGKAL